jgi:hypothetical protein
MAGIGALLCNAAGRQALGPSPRHINQCVHLISSHLPKKEFFANRPKNARQARTGNQERRGANRQRGSDRDRRDAATDRGPLPRGRIFQGTKKIFINFNALWSRGHILREARRRRGCGAAQERVAKGATRRLKKR